MVTKTDPLECVLVKSEGLLSQQKLLPSKERYRTHWRQDKNFKDSIAWRFSMDTGAKSLKGVVGPVNVEKPHSQRHILPFLAFAGLKDSGHNMK